MGQHWEDVEVWKKITPANLRKNEKITVGIFTDVQVGDYIDWIPIIYGVEVEEWATWTEDLNVNIIRYYNFNESSGDAIDLTNNNNGTLVGSPTQGVTGLIENAYSYSNSFGQYVNPNYFLTNNETLNGWVKLDTITGNTWHIFNTGTASGNGLRMGNLGDNPTATMYNGAGFDGAIQTITDTGTTMTRTLWLGC